MCRASSKSVTFQGFFVTMKLNDVKKCELDKKRFKLGIESNQSDAACEPQSEISTFFNTCVGES